MRLYTFDDLRLGVLGRDGAHVDITDLLPVEAPPRDRMNALIERWPELAEAVRARSETATGPPPDSARLRAPQPNPSKVVAAPVNYKRHQQEMTEAGGVYSGQTLKTVAQYGCFLKAPSSIIGPDASIELPFEDRRVDHEAEVGVIIGSRARHVAREDALRHVFGYVPLLDITVRGEEDRSFRKSFDTFTPIGPWITTADEVADPDAIEFALSVDGETRQRGNTRDLIYDIPRLIELCSGAMTLHPGDVLATGTPEGVGPIAAGDNIRLDVHGVGSLTMSVTAMAPPLS